MAPTLPHPRMNYRVFATLLLVALPLLAVGGLVALGVGQAQLRDTYGIHLGYIAERTAAAVDTYVFRRIIDISLLARVPEVREAAAASRDPVDVERVRSLDEQWQRDQAPPPAVATLLESPASRFLRDLVQHDPIYSELLLADREGRLVAASAFASDYFQGDEAWWRDVSRSGQVHIGDVGWDESARSYAIEISVPVFAPGSEDLVGVLKAATDTREMLTAVSGLRLGQTGQAVLVRKDGSLVYGPAGVQPGMQFFAADLLRESLGLVTPAPSGELPVDRASDPQFGVHFGARSPDGSHALVAVAPTQLGLSYPDLSWLVAVHQSENELFAAVRAQVWYLLLLLALVAIAVLVFALWFSMRLAAPPPGIDMGLVRHARIPRIDEDEEYGESLAQSLTKG